MNDSLSKLILAKSTVGFFSAQLNKSNQFVFNYANLAFSQWFNVDPQSLLNQPILQLNLFLKMKVQFHAEWNNWFQQSNHNLSFTIFCDELNKWFDILLFKVDNENIAGQIVHVSDYKLSEARLRSLIHIFEDAIFELDENLTFKDIIVPKESMLFFPKEEIIGKSIRTLFEGNLLESFERAFQLAKHTNEIQILEYDSPEVFGEKHFKARFVFRKFFEGTNDFFVTISDVTSEKKAEQELLYHRDFENLLVKCTTKIVQSEESSFGAALDYILAEIGKFSNVDRTYYFEINVDEKTASNTFEWCNDGVSAEIDNLQDVPFEVYPKWIETMMNGMEVYIDDVDNLPDDWANERELLQPQSIQSLLALPVLQGNKIFGFIGFDAVKDKVVWTETARNLLQILADNLGSVINRNLQNHALKVAKDEAQKMAVEANEANQAKSSFLANMSHEIRTPLNGVVGFSELLHSTGLSSIQKLYVDNVHRSATALMDLINDVLDFSKIEAGKLQLDEEQSNLLEIIESACSLTRLAASEKGNTFSLYVDPQLPKFVIVDAVRLRQVLVNLLSNAIKFTDNGHVLFSITRIQNQHIQAKQNAVEVVFSVEDTGIGIPEEQRQHIFKAFQQGDVSTTKKYGGTGLGLVISQNILAMMGSEIHLVSQPNVGSTFSFTLQLEQVGPDFCDFKNALASLNCAVIADSVNFRNSLSSLLSAAGASLLEFDSAKAYLENSSNNNRFDVLIVSQLNTAQALDELRNLALTINYASQKTPILFFYKSEDRRLQEVCKEFAFIHAMATPFLPSELVDRLQKLKEQEELANHQLPFEEFIHKSGLNVLIVDDSEMNLLLTNILISKMFTQVNIYQARNGLEAVDMAFNLSFDLILMDIQMPIMDGYTAIKQIREKSDHHVPIIALTANAIKGERENCIQAGADEYLSKPINKSHLFETLKSVLNK
ncbi:MAG: hypothetical protein RL226_216 [Bacteroidota bacterium]